jgi:hypothetical protein
MKIRAWVMSAPKLVFLKRSSCSALSPNVSHFLASPTAFVYHPPTDLMQQENGSLSLRQNSFTPSLKSVPNRQISIKLREGTAHLRASFVSKGLDVTDV